MTLSVIEDAAKPVDAGALATSATAAETAAAKAAGNQADTAARQVEFNAADAETFIAAEKAGATVQAAEDTKTQADKAETEYKAQKPALDALTDHTSAFTGLDDKSAEATRRGGDAAKKEATAKKFDAEAATEKKSALDSSAAAAAADEKAKAARDNLNKASAEAERKGDEAKRKRAEADASAELAKQKEAARERRRAEADEKARQAQEKKKEAEVHGDKAKQALAMAKGMREDADKLPDHASDDSEEPDYEHLAQWVREQQAASNKNADKQDEIARKCEEDAKKAVEAVKRLEKESNDASVAANEDDEEARKSNAAAEQAANAAKDAETDSGKLNEQAKQAESEAAKWADEAKECEKRANTAAGAVAAAEAAAARERQAAKLDTDKATDLDKEVSDAKDPTKTPQYQALDQAKNDLNAKTAALTALPATDPGRAAAEKAVDAAKAVARIRTLAFNAAEVKAELAKVTAAVANAAGGGVATVTMCPLPLKSPQVIRKEELVALDKKMTDFVKLYTAYTESAASLQAANTSKDAVVAARMAQLRLQGHGPQRHSDPDDAALKKRAIYGIEPPYTDSTGAAKGGNQVEDSGKLHVVGNCASKFKTQEDFVKAETQMRRKLKETVCPVKPDGTLKFPADGTSGLQQKIEPPLIDVFATPDNHCFGFQPSPPLPEVLTSLGPAVPVPPRTPPPPLSSEAPWIPAPAFPPLTYPAAPPGAILSKG